MTAGTIILVLKIAVIAVTILLVLSLVALAKGKYVLHGRINVVFFILTLSALLGLEVIARVLDPTLFTRHFEGHQAMGQLFVHLCFSLPAAALLPVMLVTGRRHSRTVHIAVGLVFLALWTGTFITGVFFLPHQDV